MVVDPHHAVVSREQPHHVMLARRIEFPIARDANDQSIGNLRRPVRQRVRSGARTFGGQHPRAATVAKTLRFTRRINDHRFVDAC